MHLFTPAAPAVTTEEDTIMSTFKTREATLKAARAQLGEDATEGLDFVLHNTGNGWTWEMVQPATAAAADAQAERTAPDAPAFETPMADARDAARENVTKKRAERKGFASGPKKAAKAAKASGKGKAPAKAKTLSVKKPAASVKAGSKTDKMISLLKRPGGASSAEMEEALGWKPHSVRGMLGTFRAQGIAIVSSKPEGEKRTVYRWPKEAAAAPQAAAPDADAVL